MSSSGQPNVCNRVHGAPENGCGYTPAFAGDDSTYCGAEAVYEAVNRRGRHFLLCIEHAAWARAHVKAETDLTQLRSAVAHA